MILCIRVCAFHVEGWIRECSLHVFPKGLEKEEGDILPPDVREVGGLLHRSC